MTNNSYYLEINWNMSLEHKMYKNILNIIRNTQNILYFKPCMSSVGNYNLL